MTARSRMAEPTKVERGGRRRTGIALGEVGGPSRSASAAGLDIRRNAVAGSRPERRARTPSCPAGDGRAHIG